jgi:hypothetical protein
MLMAKTLSRTMTQLWAAMTAKWLGYVTNHQFPINDPIDKMTAIAKTCLRSLSAYDPVNRTAAPITFTIKRPFRSGTRSGVAIIITKSETNSVRCRQRNIGVGISNKT